MLQDMMEGLTGGRYFEEQKGRRGRRFCVGKRLRSRGAGSVTRLTPKTVASNPLGATRLLGKSNKSSRNVKSTLTFPLCTSTAPNPEKHEQYPMLWNGRRGIPRQPGLLASPAILQGACWVFSVQWKDANTGRACESTACNAQFC